MKGNERQSAQRLSWRTWGAIGRLPALAALDRPPPGCGSRTRRKGADAGVFPLTSALAERITAPTPPALCGCRLRWAAGGGGSGSGGGRPSAWSIVLLASARACAAWARSLSILSSVILRASRTLSSSAMSALVSPNPSWSSSSSPSP